jgi:hypothetical protein
MSEPTGFRRRPFPKHLANDGRYRIIGDLEEELEETHDELSRIDGPKYGPWLGQVEEKDVTEVETFSEGLGEQFLRRTTVLEDIASS